MYKIRGKCLDISDYGVTGLKFRNSKHNVVKNKKIVGIIGSELKLNHMFPRKFQKHVNFSKNSTH